MSWQAYVDDTLIGSGSVDKAAIFDVTGKSVWATSTDFQLTQEEIDTAVTLLNEIGSGKAPSKTSITVAGSKYIIIHSVDRSIYARLGNEGIVVVRTKLAMLIAHYPTSVQPGSAANTVEKLADYLVKSGY